MSAIEITSELTPFGDLKVYVTADAGTHHSTIASAVLKHVRALPQPEYHPHGAPAKPGKWCAPAYYGAWKRVGSNVTPDSRVRKYFAAWPVPA